MTDQDIEKIEGICGVRLMECQKEMLKNYEPGDKLYVDMYKVRRQERMQSKVMSEVAKAIMGGGIND